MGVVEGPQIIIAGREIIFTAQCQIRILIKETASMVLDPPIYMEGPLPPIYMEGLPQVTFSPEGLVNTICPHLPYLGPKEEQLNMELSPLFMNIIIRGRNVPKSTSQPQNPLPTYIYNLIMVPGMVVAIWIPIIEV